MHILSTLGFQKVLEQRLKVDFGSLGTDAIKESQWYGVLDGVKSYIDIDPYYKLMAHIAPSDHVRFLRFYDVCIRKYFADEFDLKERIDWIDVKNNNKLQVLYIVCMQYYFS